MMRNRACSARAGALFSASVIAAMLAVSSAGAAEEAFVPISQDESRIEGAIELRAGSIWRLARADATRLAGAHAFHNLPY